MFYDLNGDGILDIVYATGRLMAYNLLYWSCEDKPEAEEACTEDFGFAPCGTTVHAFDGVDGSVLWQFNSSYQVFAVVCPADLNSDHHIDCLAAGRLGTWAAIDGRNGELLWNADYSVVVAMFNFYFPLAVGDLDKDGTVDFIGLHGGDPRFEPSEVDRAPAQIILLSGRTGKKLMEPVLVPDMHESYSNPVLFTDRGANKFVLFGTGGETIGGSLWAISVESIQQKVDEFQLRNNGNNEDGNETMKDPHCTENLQDFAKDHLPKPNFKQYVIEDQLSEEEDADFYKGCPHTIFKPIPNVHQLCVYEVIYSPERGVMLPPVLIDMDSDYQEDLIISLYSGHTLRMDGSTGNIVWDRYIPGTETYRLVRLLQDAFMHNYVYIKIVTC